MIVHKRGKDILCLRSGMAKERRFTMTIQWLTSFDEGIARARGEGKLLFLDFFNPG
jgi:hypothetical protein